MPDRVRTETLPRAAAVVILAFEPDPADPVLGRPVAGRSLLDRAVDTAARYGSEVVVAGDVTTDRCRTRSLERDGDLRAALADLLPGTAPDAVTLVHDLVWATVSEKVWARVLRAAGEQPVVPVIDVTDTVRDCRGALVDRAELRQCQSPRAYRRRALDRVLAPGAGDDLGGLADHDVEVVLVAGDEAARPLVHRRDLALASARIAS